MDIQELDLNLPDNMKYSLFLLLLIGCTNVQDKGSVNRNSYCNDDSTYVESQITYVLEGYLNYAKWRMYCQFCDVKVEFTDKAKHDTSITYGQLELKCNSADLYQGYVHLELSFIYNDTLTIDEQVVDNFLYSTVAFDTINFQPHFHYNGLYTPLEDSVQYLIHENGPDFDYRVLYPLQPDVVNYIKENKEKLHPWFYNEAKKRGVIE